MKLSKKGQIEVTFNWVYVLIAGAVIILFFVGIAVKQKASSERTLSSDVVRIMESIFTSAGASEKTKNIIDVSGLSDYTLQFSCSNGVSELAVADIGSQRRQNAIDPSFSPAEIKTTQLILWSLPYKLPFKAIDLLFISSSNTQYVVLGDRNGFAQEFLAETNEFNREQVASLAALDPGDNFQVRIIDFAGTLQEGFPLDNSALAAMADDKVTAVSFIADSEVNYYRKINDVLVRTNHDPVPLISFGGEKDAVRYAAIFSADQELYQCNMQKAIQRLKNVAAIYAGRELLLEEYYTQRLANGQAVGECLGFLRDNSPDNIKKVLEKLQIATEDCLSGIKNNDFQSCTGILDPASHLRETNKLLGEDCGVTLY